MWCKFFASKNIICLTYFFKELLKVYKALVSAAHLSGAPSVRSSGGERERERNFFSDSWARAQKIQKLRSRSYNHDMFLFFSIFLIFF